MAPFLLEYFSFKDESDIYMSLRFVNHGVTVVNVIDTVVKGLHDVKALVPVVQELGLYHARKGIKADLYPVVEKSFINTMRAGLQREFTNRMMSSWRELFKVIIKVMKSDFFTNGDILVESLTPHKIRLIRHSW